MKNRIIKFVKHETTGAYLNLDYDNGVEFVVNLNYLIHANYDENYPNGYGEYLSRLSMKTTDGKIVLYRKDADEVWSKIKDLIKE